MHKFSMSGGLDFFCVFLSCDAWGTDITYIRLSSGWLYLVVILDWFSRYVVSWELSTTLEVDFCIRALEKAFDINKPEIFNSDQGSQFTCSAFINKLKEKDIKISMDGRGRAMDNIFNERFWRSIKYEEVYIKDYQSIIEAKNGIESYMNLAHMCFKVKPHYCRSKNNH